VPSFRRSECPIRGFEDVIPPLLLLLAGGEIKLGSRDDCSDCDGGDEGGVLPDEHDIKLGALKCLMALVAGSYTGW
jgi:hypothetical protein